LYVAVALVHIALGWFRSLRERVGALRKRGIDRPIATPLLNGKSSIIDARIADQKATSPMISSGQPPWSCSQLSKPNSRSG
jgi:hypothetical protein